jgi:hypothetical protein
MVIGEFQRHAVGDDRALADRNVREWAGMDKDGLSLDGLEEIRIDRLDHPGGHRPRHIQVGGGDRLPLFVVGHDDPPHSLPKIPESRRDGEDRHDLRTYGDGKTGAHHETVHLPAETDHDLAEGLGTEVDRPFHLDIPRIDVEPPEVLGGQHRIVIVEFVLHPRGQRDHRQIVGAGHTVDVAGEPQGKGGKRDALG